MKYLSINNLSIDNKKITATFNNKEIIGLLGNSKMINEFLLIISGINKNKNCFYDNKILFNNYDYSKNRLFLDFKETYTTTLRKDYIKDNLKNRFDLDFDGELFKKNINRLNIRKEANFDISYHFTNKGNTLVNYSLVNAISINNLIISNPTIYLEQIENIKEIVDELTNKNKYYSVIIYPNNFSQFENKFDKIMIFTSDNIVVSDKASLIVMEDNIFKRNVICNAIDNNIICYHDFTKEELKDFSRRNIKYKVISVYDIDKYQKGGLSI